MFIGHIAVAYSVKKAAPKTSLGTLVFAAQLPDLLWPVFLLLGLERAAIVPGSTAVTPLAFTSYPLSHSLLADVGWGLLLAGVYVVLKKNVRGACWLCLCVVSHWVLDAISHRPDLPLFPGGHIFVGLGLWNSRLGTVTLEMGMFIAGVAIYLSATRARDRTGVWSFWMLNILLAFIYFGNLFGPPPPSMAAVAYAGLLGVGISVAWCAWIDRHRMAPARTPSWD
jgi:LexA-binding, inner membrane-associated putative hydrolase